MVVGRAEELDALAQALQRAADAVPTPLLLVGDPGVGKSILLRSVSSSARDRGFRVLAAACPAHQSRDWPRCVSRCGRAASIPRRSLGGSSGAEME